MAGEGDSGGAATATASHERWGKGRSFVALTSNPGDPLPLTPPSPRAPRLRPGGSCAAPPPQKTADGAPRAPPDVRGAGEGRERGEGGYIWRLLRLWHIGGRQDKGGRQALNAPERR